MSGRDESLTDTSLAFFLDLDGTLLDIAPTPAAVHVPDGLVTTLSQLRDRVGGALAIVSGRSLIDIDRLLAPLHMVAAAEHGAVVRLPDGRIEETEVVVPPAWISSLDATVSRVPGALVERKPHAVVVHYRQAPAAEARLRHAVDVLVATAPDRFEVLPARMAFEIRGRGISKEAAVHRLLQEAPFAGRLPVYVGDDVTDEPAIDAAIALGGRGLHVAHAFGGTPDAVRRWLAALATGT